MTNAIITAVALLAALFVTAAKGINPVQHSEGRPTTQTASKGINPVQHSE